MAQKKTQMPFYMSEETITKWVQTEKGVDWHRQMDWRWMKQEKGLFGGLFSDVADDSLHRILFS